MSLNLSPSLSEPYFPNTTLSPHIGVKLSGRSDLAVFPQRKVAATWGCSGHVDLRRAASITSNKEFASSGERTGSLRFTVGPPGSLSESVTCSDLTQETNPGETPDTGVLEAFGMGTAQPVPLHRRRSCSSLSLPVPEIAGPESSPLCHSSPPPLRFSPGSAEEQMHHGRGFESCLVLKAASVQRPHVPQLPWSPQGTLQYNCHCAQEIPKYGYFSGY